MTTSRYYVHTLCSNEPEHVQGFPDGPQGQGGPQAGVRCDGCGGPTAVYDWEPAAPPPTTCIRCGYRLYWSSRRNEYRRREKGHGQKRIDCGNGNHIPRAVPA